MKAKPFFITFEGGEGAGKSTQIKLVSSYLIERGMPHLVTREPGGTPLAEKIRSLLVEGSAMQMDVLTEYLLFSAARRDHLLKVIKPALERGESVLCDRFYDSSYVYQGLTQNLSLSIMKVVYEAVAGEGFEPDLTFVFDLDPLEGLKRTQERGGTATRFESKGVEFHRKIRENFQKITQSFSHRCILIDADKNAEQVLQEIRSYLEKRMPSL